MSTDSRQGPGPDPRVDHDALLAELEAMDFGGKNDRFGGKKDKEAVYELPADLDLKDVEQDLREQDQEPDQEQDGQAEGQPEQPGGFSLGMGVAAGVAIGVAVAVVAAILAGLPRPTERVVAVPSSPVVPPSQPASGSDIIKAASTGGGTLVLENPGDLDAVVTLANATTYTRAVYVRGGDRVTVPDIAAGTYEILWTIGYNWQGGRFAASASYQQLDGSVEFTEKNSGAGPEYTRLTLVVQRAADGTAGIVATEPFQLIAP